MARIVELGNTQLIEQGVAGLSVREIARGLGMVSSAIYRYVGSRDELLTLLIVDAFADLADSVDAAVSAAGTSEGGDPRARFLALGDAMCAWAIAHPERWTLLYGTPVRDYAAPADTTNADGTRVMQAVLHIAADAAEQGSIGRVLRRDRKISPRRSPRCSRATWPSSVSRPLRPRSSRH